ncbi:fimbrial protein [Citrobacter braakii]|uniref:fimbrial protein n=1 Tax=Citrobacter braakii TaxID=57706 RepID=UPI0040394DC5
MMETRHCPRLLLSLISVTVVATMTTFTPVRAAQTGDHVAYAFTGKLIADPGTPCTVNNNKVIDVPFGNVGVNKLNNGTDYAQDIHWTLECAGAVSSSIVQMVITATPESWDPKAMSSNVTGLGVRILKDGTPLDLNTKLPVTPGTTPLLQAKLVREPATELTEQPFSATGTITVVYF